MRQWEKRTASEKVRDMKLPDVLRKARAKHRSISKTARDILVQLHGVPGGSADLAAALANMNNMVTEHERPDLFNTASYNDKFDYTLHRPDGTNLPVVPDGDISDQNAQSHRNPACVDFWFFLKTKVTDVVLGTGQFGVMRWYFNRYEYQHRGVVHRHQLAKLNFMRRRYARGGGDAGDDSPASTEFLSPDLGYLGTLCGRGVMARRHIVASIRSATALLKKDGGCPRRYRKSLTEALRALRSLRK